ncbi:head completion/stabilization protein [Dickeya poaceiphila]|uniref:Head completion/stabilization protein n=1 Tax=Dickeya poaceiphila TaxID=568768 RepID=A0A5B8I6I9_9GAMM|nr:head completion/stabilization protein [Dickeya poaceiphila]QDX29598.1 head completion/stabilization protein [Dickeya poaceiphila]
MSLVAQKRVSDSGDVPEIDDGAAAVSTGAFWPVIVLRDLRLAARITGGITTTRLMHVTTEAVVHVTDQLASWQQTQQATGYAALADVPAGQVNGESIKVYRFRRAVYAIARALLLEGYRDVDTTAKGDKATDTFDNQRDDLWRDARWSIADIRGAQRLFAELC